MSVRSPGQKFDYDRHARSRPLDDYWGQVLRTVKGIPVSEDQIDRIVSAICTGLDFEPGDELLDIACGNGALSQRLFGFCARFLGVDISPRLISVACANFKKTPDVCFLEAGAGDYIVREPHPERFTKVLCYGSFQYFSEDDAGCVLHTLFQRFRGVQRCFIGNLPDRERAFEFYKESVTQEVLSDHQTAIGIWRTRQEFESLARQAGWTVHFSTMPNEFYASYYRYDALLMRAS